MIKITLNPDSHPETFSFHQDVVIIGEGAAPAVDLSIPGLGLHQTHLKINHQDGLYYVRNQSNDPYVSLNGQPFGKHLLQEGDLLHIHHTTLRIDQLSFHAKELNPEDISSQQATRKARSAGDRVSKIARTQTITPFSSLNRGRWEERHGYKRQKSHPFNPHPSKKQISHFLKWTLTATVILVFLLGGLTVKYVLKEKNLSLHNQMVAAAATADIAMAITYTRFYHIEPPHQNWTDPEFLDNNLREVLPNDSFPSGNIDSQGNLKDTPYKLRIYTSQKNRLFLLVAQPKPDFSQWIAPKRAIVIHSNLMDIRATTDLKDLNRLLSSQEPLEESPNQREIYNTLVKFSILSLDTVAKETDKPQFNPPRALALLHPGTENFIYNAPRYHHFGNDLVRKVISLVDVHGNTNPNKEALQAELEFLDSLQNAVLYSSEGFERAVSARLALAQIFPDKTFWTGYLSFGPNHDYKTSFLVLDHDIWSQVPYKNQRASQMENKQRVQKEEEKIHRAFLTLAWQRTQALRPLSQEIGHLIHQDTLSPLPSLFDQLHSQLAAYTTMREEQDRILIRSIKDLYYHHREIPKEAFQEMLAKAGLKTVPLPREPHNFAPFLPVDPVASEEVPLLFPLTRPRPPLLPL